MKQSTRRNASALVAGAAALLLWTPIARADDPPDCDQLPPDQKQQCEQQKGAGIANRAIDEAQQGTDQAQKQLQQQQQQDPRNKPISQVGYMYSINGVLTCVHSSDGALPDNSHAYPIYPAQPC